MNIFGKAILFLLLLITSFTITPYFLFVQAQCVITNVGNPKLSPNPPPECGTPNSGDGASGSCGTVVAKGKLIADNLSVGESGYDKLGKAGEDPSKYKSCGYTARHSIKGFIHYWCTFLITDAYKLAGIKNVTTNGFVVDMHSWWMKASGFKYVEYDKTSDKKQAVLQIGPGYAMFMENVYLGDKQHAHVGMVAEVKVNKSTGNGTITTHEANSSKPHKTYQVAKWQIQRISYPVRAFGGK